MKVYVVTEGEYSDYGIVKVFLDKEKAEKYAELYEKTERFADNVNVEEYTIYDDSFDSNLTEPIEFYVQYIDLENGKLGWDGKEKIISTKKSFYDIGCGTMLKACSQKSAEHAKKIAIEQYQIRTQQAFEIGINKPYKEYLKEYLEKLKS